MGESFLFLPSPSVEMADLGCHGGSIPLQDLIDDGVSFGTGSRVTDVAAVIDAIEMVMMSGLGWASQGGSKQTPMSNLT